MRRARQCRANNSPYVSRIGCNEIPGTVAHLALGCESSILCILFEVLDKAEGQSYATRKFATSKGPSIRKGR